MAGTESLTRHLLALIRTNPLESLFPSQSIFCLLQSVFQYCYMAPVARTPHTMSAPAILPVRAKGTSEYTTIIVGHGSSAVTNRSSHLHDLVPEDGPNPRQQPCEDDSSPSDRTIAASVFIREYEISLFTTDCRLSTTSALSSRLENNHSPTVSPRLKLLPSQPFTVRFAPPLPHHNHPAFLDPTTADPTSATTTPSATTAW